MNPLKHPLVEAWRKISVTKPPFVLPADRATLEGEFSESRSFEQYVRSDEFTPDDDKLHVGLLPGPYAGDLSRASIFVLMLNPGLKPGDYFSEDKHRAFRRAQVHALRQEHLDPEYPFQFLNPQFSFHPGFRYWEGKLRGIARGHVKRQHVSYQEALSALSKRIATIELFPYHSRSFSFSAKAKKLPSVSLARQFVTDVVVPKAQADEAVIIVTRRVRDWGLKHRGNIVCYDGGKARAAHLSPNSDGGKAILKKLYE